jgi:hypothetical protein
MSTCVWSGSSISDSIEIIFFAIELYQAFQQFKYHQQYQA